jgi:hypothetical protein
MKPLDPRTPTSPLAALETDLHGWRLSAHRRAAVLRAAVQTGSDPSQASFARPFFTAPVLSWAGALMMAFLVVGVGYYWAPGSYPPAAPSFGTVRVGDSAHLVASQRGDAVLLEWTDGGRDVFTVRRSDSPRAVYDAPGVKVQGHRYVDRSASSSPIVYYLVE